MSRVPNQSDFPALGSFASQPTARTAPSARNPSPWATPWATQASTPTSSSTPSTPVAPQTPAAAEPPPAAGQQAIAPTPPPPAAAPPALYSVHGSKKGGFPVTVETRARGKKVTVIHNVTGDCEALLADLKRAVGAGGVLRDGDVEIQGEHEDRVAAFLVKSGCVRGVTAANKAAAAPAPKKPAAPPKSIARLDKKAQELKQQKR